jgi:hypothetical protein
MHAHFLFFVLPIVSRVVRAQLVKSAGRIFYVHGRPAQLVGGAWSIVHEPSRPTSAVVIVLCGVMACPDVHEPVGARATRRGLCCAELCAVVHGRRLQAPTGSRVAYGCTTAVETIRACRRLSAAAAAWCRLSTWCTSAGRPSWADVATRAPGRRLALKIREVFQLLG